MPAIDWPIYKNCFANYITFGHKSPIARIITHQSIITHNKIVIGRNYPFVSCWIYWRLNIRLIQQDSINPYCFAIYDNHISRHTNHTFYQVFVGINRPMKNNHISSFGSMKKIC